MSWRGSLPSALPVGVARPARAPRRPALGSDRSRQGGNHRVRPNRSRSTSREPTGRNRPRCRNRGRPARAGGPPCRNRRGQIPSSRPCCRNRGGPARRRGAWRRRARGRAGRLSGRRSLVVERRARSWAGRLSGRRSLVVERRAGRRRRPGCQPLRGRDAAGWRPRLARRGRWGQGRRQNRPEAEAARRRRCRRCRRVRLRRCHQSRVGVRRSGGRVPLSFDLFGVRQLHRRFRL